jgi:hypothetical protein
MASSPFLGRYWTSLQASHRRSLTKVFQIPIHIAAGGDFNMAYVANICPVISNLVAFVEMTWPTFRAAKSSLPVKYAQYSNLGPSRYFAFRSHHPNRAAENAWAAGQVPWNICVDKAWASLRNMSNSHSNGQAKLFMEASILHEMCHRGDRVDAVALSRPA